jgi:hypothetical protein
MQRWLRIKLNNLGKTILSYTDTVLVYKSISISNKNMYDLIRRALDEVSCFASNHNLPLLENLVMRVTHPCSQYPWLYYRDWADDCNDPY